jgi:hypothetical protein
MTDREILTAYYQAERECGGPHCINDAIWKVVSDNPGLTRDRVKEVVIQDQVGGAV